MLGQRDFNVLGRVVRDGFADQAKTMVPEVNEGVTLPADSREKEAGWRQGAGDSCYRVLSLKYCEVA